MVASASRTLVAVCLAPPKEGCFQLHYWRIPQLQFQHGFGKVPQFLIFVQDL